MNDEQRPVHQHEHTEPTVIQHNDEDMTVLARWLQRAMDQGAQFWLLLIGSIAALVAVAVIASGVFATKPTAVEAWGELIQAKTAEERLKIADAHPKTPVSNWARLMAAQEEYSNGIDDLTTSGKKELAGPRLKKALELFQQVAKEAPKDSSQALCAMFGAARTLEARNELPEAIEQYRLVASRFPKAPEAKQALSLAKALEEPINVTFYKELYAYKPPANPKDGFGGPGSPIPPPFGSPPASNLKSFFPDLKVPAGLDAPPGLTPDPKVEPPKSETPKTEPAKAETPKTETPKTETPKAEPPAAPTTTVPTPVEVPKSAEPPK